MKTAEIKQLALSTYRTKGLNGLNCFLKKFVHRREVINFGLSSYKNKQAKELFIYNCPENEIRVHYYSTLTTSKNGFRYNRLRAIKITLP